MLSRGESYLVMKVIIVKEVMTCDVSPVAMFFLARSNEERCNKERYNKNDATKKNATN